MYPKKNMCIWVGDKPLITFNYSIISLITEKTKGPKIQIIRFKNPKILLALYVKHMCKLSSKQIFMVNLTVIN